MNMENVMQSAGNNGHKVMPWWMGYLVDNPLRRWLEPLDRHLTPYLRPGMHALDIGCGFGYYTIAMARMVEPQGKVHAVDVQRRMLDNAMRRARKAGVGERIVPHLCGGARLDLSEDVQVDFAVAGNVLHELIDMKGVLVEIGDVLVPDGLLYVVEPQGHVKRSHFDAEVDLAESLGYTVAKRPKVSKGHCVVLKNSGAVHGAA